MILNYNMTQLDIVESNLNLFEENKIKDEKTLRKLLPYCIQKVDKEHILFFNRYYEVILDINNNHYNSFLNILNMEENQDYYKNPSNFEYLYIEAELFKNCINFYNDVERITDKKNHKAYIKRLRKVIDLIKANKAITTDDAKSLILKESFNR